MITKSIAASFIGILVFTSAWAAASQSQSQNNIIGELPASVEWYYDKPKTVFYLSYNQLHLTTPQMAAGGYNVDLGSDSFNFYSLNYLSHVYGDRKELDQKNWNPWAVWARYDLGLGFKQGEVSSSSYSLSASSTSSYLGGLFMSAGLQLEYDRWDLFSPYVGVQLLGFTYKHSAAASGADAEGNGAGYEPLAGARMTLPNSKTTLFGEARWTSAFNGSGKIAILSSGVNLSFGLGRVF